jgi:hypothetical protein
VFRLYWVIIRPIKELIQGIEIYNAFWDPWMHYKILIHWICFLEGLWWLNRVETCCHKNNLCNKLLCMTEIYTLYELVFWFILTQAYHQQTRTPNTRRWHTHAATCCVIIQTKRTQMSGRNNNGTKHSGGPPEDGREKGPKHVRVLYLQTRF